MENSIYVPLILALTEVTKRFGIDIKWSPVIAMVMGVVISGIVSGFTANSIIQGIIWGLASSGIYSSGKTLGKAVGLVARTS